MSWRRCSVKSKRKEQQEIGDSSTSPRTVSATVTERLLRRELARLQGLSDMGWELRVEYIPGGSDRLEGEVIGGRIRIYSRTRPLKKLRHEFFDFLVTQAAKPFADLCNIQRTVVNGVLNLLEQRAYHEKESVVEAIQRMFDRSAVTRPRDERECGTSR